MSGNTLTHLAVDANVAASTQIVAMHAIPFLYRHVIKIELTGINAMRAKKNKHLPVVFTKSEVRRVLEKISGPPFRLQANLLYLVFLFEM